MLSFLEAVAMTGVWLVVAFVSWSLVFAAIGYAHRQWQDIKPESDSKTDWLGQPPKK